jgi:uncharacterized protein (DUF58 family)
MKAVSPTPETAAAAAKGALASAQPADAIRADARLRRLEWTVFKRLDGLLQGDWRTFFRGHGLDLAELREYQHHDDVRRIDWNVTARLNQPFVREYLEDREATAWFLLDLSPSIDFGTRARKRSVAVDLVAVLATALVRKGHRVGAHLYGRNVAPRGKKAAGAAPGSEAPLPARSGRRQVLELMQRIGERPRPALVRDGGVGGEGTRLDRMLHAAHANLRGRCVVFVVSDFISAPGWDAPLGALARRHDVVAVRIVDPAEREMPDVGLVPMVDAETGERMLVDTSSAKFRERYAKAAQRREAQVHEALARAGVDTLELDTGDNLADALLRFVHARRERARLSAGGATRRPPRTSMSSSSPPRATATP